MQIVTMVSSEYFHFSLTTEIAELRDVIYGISQNGSGKVQTLQASRLCSTLCFSSNLIWVQGERESFIKDRKRYFQ